MVSSANQGNRFQSTDGEENNKVLNTSFSVLKVIAIPTIMEILKSLLIGD